jgi:hypothetical protein
VSEPLDAADSQRVRSQAKLRIASRRPSVAAGPGVEPSPRDVRAHTAFAVAVVAKSQAVSARTPVRPRRPSIDAQRAAASALAAGSSAERVSASLAAATAATAMAHLAAAHAARTAHELEGGAQRNAGRAALTLARQPLSEHEGSLWPGSQFSSRAAFPATLDGTVAMGWAGSSVDSSAVGSAHGVQRPRRPHVGARAVPQSADASWASAATQRSWTVDASRATFDGAYSLEAPTWSVIKPTAAQTPVGWPSGVGVRAGPPPRTVQRPQQSEPVDKPSRSTSPLARALGRALASSPSWPVAAVESAALRSSAAKAQRPTLQPRRTSQMHGDAEPPHDDRAGAFSAAPARAPIIPGLARATAGTSQPGPASMWPAPLLPAPQATARRPARPCLTAVGPPPGRPAWVAPAPLARSPPRASGVVDGSFFPGGTGSAATSAASSRAASPMRPFTVRAARLDAVTRARSASPSPLRQAPLARARSSRSAVALSPDRDDLQRSLAALGNDVVSPSILFSSREAAAVAAATAGVTRAARAAAAAAAALASPAAPASSSVFAAPGAHTAFHDALVRHAAALRAAASSSAATISGAAGSPSTTPVPIPAPGAAAPMSQPPSPEVVATTSNVTSAQASSEAWEVTRPAPAPGGSTSPGRVNFSQFLLLQRLQTAIAGTHELRTGIDSAQQRRVPSPLRAVSPASPPRNAASAAPTPMRGFTRAVAAAGAGSRLVAGQATRATAVGRRASPPSRTGGGFLAAVRRSTVQHPPASAVVAPTSVAQQPPSPPPAAASQPASPLSRRSSRKSVTFDLEREREQGGERRGGSPAPPPSPNQQRQTATAVPVRPLQTLPSPPSDGGGAAAALPSSVATASAASAMLSPASDPGAHPLDTQTAIAADAQAAAPANRAASPARAALSSTSAPEATTHSSNAHLEAAPSAGSGSEPGFRAARELDLDTWRARKGMRIGDVVASPSTNPQLERGRTPTPSPSPSPAASRPVTPPLPLPGLSSEE